MAKLRVGCMEAGCTPGVRSTAKRFLFHWTTGFVETAAMFCACRPAPANVRARMVLIILDSFEFRIDAASISHYGVLRSARSSILGNPQKYSRSDSPTLWHHGRERSRDKCQQVQNYSFIRSGNSEYRKYSPWLAITSTRSYPSLPERTSTSFTCGTRQRWSMLLTLTPVPLAN